MGEVLGEQVGLKRASAIVALGNYRFLQADATRLPFADQTFDLVFGSPPYCDARTYGIDAQRGCVQWVEWMILCTLEAQRVCKGPVIWVAAGVTRKRNYWPACEGLMWEWWKRGGDCQLYRPCFWNRVGIPGSGGDDWFRADVEYVMCFKRPGALAWADNTAMGHPPKWGPGGEMSHRLGSGKRVNQWGPVGSAIGMGNRFKRGKLIDDAAAVQRPSHMVCGGGSRRANGKIKDGGYDMPVKANPGNLVKIIVGGGVMGHPLAHENEAPFPSDLARYFIKSLCKPAGKVLDPFSGSGTTVGAAVQEGRDGTGTDIRASQVELGIRRLRNPHAKKTKRRTTTKTLDPELFASFAEGGQP